MADEESKESEELESSTDNDSDIVARDGDDAIDAVDASDLETEVIGADGEHITPADLSAQKYVFATFAAAGVLGALLIGKIFTAIWNSLASWPTAARAVPQLLRTAEDDREFPMSVIGVLISGTVTFLAYSKPDVRTWADAVAEELGKVHWPDRDTVQNGTVVVMVATLFATIYVGLLDRLWGFVTTLVYGT